MIDFHEYQRMQNESPTFKPAHPNMDDLHYELMDSEMMQADEPPIGPHIYIFPDTVPGYNLRNKKWGELLP